MKLVLIVALSCFVAGSALAQTQVQTQKPKAALDSQSETSEQEQMRLQKIMDRKKKAQETQSNIIKKQSDTNEGIIKNMK